LGGGRDISDGVGFWGESAVQAALGGSHISFNMLFLKHHFAEATDCNGGFARVQRLCDPSSG
jgi:hypothetical protein